MEQIILYGFYAPAEGFWALPGRTKIQSRFARNVVKSDFLDNFLG